MTLHDPLIGTLLDGRYRVEQRVATGGMATVYRGTDTRLDRVLALKVMHPALAGDREFTERFIREAKAVARLAHPNVVNVFDQGADGRTVFLAMEYVPGRTLRDVLLDRGALSVRAALDIMEPVLAALGAAHRAGLVHRDVKPENVLITDNGLVKVADFGLVRLLSGADGAATTTTSAGTVLGTVSYLAPEQIRQDGPTDQRVDVYAAGILLYEMLTGAKPHTGDNPMQVLYQHLHVDVPPPSLAAPGVGPELDAIVAAATARDPQARPYDAVELLAALQRARRGLTPAQLDAEPPASARPTPQYPTGEVTSALSPARQMERTSVMQVPELLLDRPRPVDEPAPVRLRGPRRSRRPLIWGSVLAALLVVVGGATYFLSGALYTTVPSVLGQSQAQAVSTLDGAGLQGVFSQQFSESVPSGQVLATDPGVGQRMRKSDPVRVTLSKGPERIAVPNVVGQPLAQAQRALTGARLTPGTTTEEYSDTVPAGSVVGVTPDVGQQLAPNAPVALVVSKGMVPVPNVVGLSKDDATKALTDAGFKVQSNGLNLFAIGKVTSQNPTAGQPRPQGTSVTINFGLF
ncbi:Stk1 family PASTA domain-containing Ser/Thr kinase [Kitasatospora sp. MAP5-34]|uniref:Stk1 family PASTA domain-containing Ser/Thr kinase n=1 Tax=Kitasatospora sp. MAP5-34 TaxID=3035102 RepID=UPI002474B60A|nr:Stk1 family PASTA domain-containing Ser/Thr kinase [Kitasatospora sp. MAP5-34]